MLSGGVAGYYRDDQKTLYVVSRSGEVGANEKITFAHEFDHALQDQHFTIFKDQEGVTNRSDWLLARQALYEGDASLLMTLWASENFTPEEFQELLAQGLNDPSSQMLERMPAILRETLLYPYTTGLTFAQGQYISGGGWAGVDALYDNVPETTEQILHPEKYQAGEGPVEIDVPDDFAARIGPDWKLALDDTFGEFQTGVWLRDADAANATEAAAGWGGDRVLVLDGPGDAWATRAGHGMGHRGGCGGVRGSRRVPWSRRWTIRPHCSPAGRTRAAGSWSRATTTCSRRSAGRSAWRVRSPGRRPTSSPARRSPATPGRWPA